MYVFIALIICTLLRTFSTNESPLCENTQKKVFVSHKYGPGNCTEKSQQINCSTIADALSIVNLNDVCIVIEEDQILTQAKVLNEVNNLTLTGVTNITVDCKSTLNAGIYVHNSTGLVFRNLHIKQCGSVYNQFFGRHFIGLSSALFLSEIVNVTFRSVIFTNSVGYSVALLNGKGEINFQRVLFQNNTIFRPSNSSIGCHSGGGLLIWYSQTNNKIGNINLESTTFQWNVGEIISTANSSLDETAVPFGRGAGLGIFFTATSSNNILTITNCKFLNNKGLWGGGLFVSFGDQSSYNTVFVKETLFSENHAVLHGGGSRIIGISMVYNIIEVKFEACNFSYNDAVSGGALSVNKKFTYNKVSLAIKNCLFFNNSAQLGSAVYIIRVTLIINNSKFFFNFYWGFEKTVGQGAVYAYGNEILFFSKNVLENNLNTAIILEKAIANISGQLHLNKNKGDKGSAFVLYVNSKIILSSNSSISFVDNSGLYGGAIYVEESETCSFYVGHSHAENRNCFLNKHPSAKLEYSNNTVNYQISDIFATTLKCCHLNLSYFGTNNVKTNPVKIIVFQENFTEIYPGKTITPTVLLYDELNQNISSAIDVYQNGTLQSFLVKKNEISIKVLGQRNAKYLLIFSFKNVHQSVIEFQTNSCTLGYTMESDSCICNQQKNNLKGMICNIEGGISLLAGLYVDYYQKAIKTDNETTHTCPFGYCRSCPNLTCSFGPNEQCANERTGFLCSQCPTNKTVELGGEKCVDQCSWFSLLFILVGMIVIFGIVCLSVVCLNICIYEAWLNVWIYFYQVIEYHITVSQLREKIFLNTFVINIINFSGVHLGNASASFCLVKKWNDLDKLAFNYLLPFTMICSVILISQCNKLYEMLQTLNNKLVHLSILKTEHEESFYLNRPNNCIKIFVLISVLAYADITRITFSILHPVEHDGVKNRVYLYASETFFSNNHRFYAPIAIVMLVFVVLLSPLLLITTVWWTKWKFFQKFGGWYPIFSAFNGPFRDHFQWFASFYFIFRVIIIAFGVFIEDKILQLLFVTTVSLIVLVVFVLCFPYKKASSNYFETFVLFLLVLIGALSNGKHGLNIGEYNSLIFNITKILMHLPCIIIFRWLYCFAVWINLKGKNIYSILS